MLVDMANAWLDLVLALGAVIVLIVGIHRWANRKLEQRIIASIKEATYQIQPSTNGGKSLSDLHKKVDNICTDISLLKQAVVQLEEDVSHIEEDLEDMQ
jgi:sensor domain CHASE-containing protein